jgi:hypothetical protein
MGFKPRFVPTGIFFNETGKPVMQYLQMETAWQAGLIPVLVGQPGTAKTAIINSCFDRLHVLYGSSINPEDVHGIVTISGDGDAMERKPMQWLTELNRMADETDASGNPVHRVAIFIDEMNHLDEVGQRALMRIFNERLVGEVRIHPNVRLVGAMNTIEQGGGYDFVSALPNRFKQIQWKPDFESWYRYMEELSPSHGEAVAFFIRNQNIIQVFPTAESERANPWPSMRSWTNALKDIDAYQSQTEYISRMSGRSKAEHRQIIQEIATGYVGHAAAQTYGEYMQRLDLIDPELILKDPKLLKASATLDATYAQLYSLTDSIINSPSKTHTKAGQNTRANGYLDALEHGLETIDKDMVGVHIRRVMNHWFKTSNKWEVKIDFKTRPKLNELYRILAKTDVNASMGSASA